MSGPEFFFEAVQTGILFGIYFVVIAILRKI